MRPRSFFLFVALLAFSFRAHTQTNSKLSNNRLTDSLRQALLHATHDTEQIRLRCLLGMKASNYRVPYWDSLLADVRSHKMYLHECRVLDGLGRAYLIKEKNEQAMKYLTLGLNMAEAKGYMPEQIALIKHLEIVYLAGLSGKKLLDLCYKGLKVAEELGDKLAVVDFYSDIARCYFFAEDKQKSLEMHLKCLQICKELDYHFGIASALVDVGSDYISLGDTRTAAKYYLESGKYAQEQGTTVYAAYIYNSVGSAYSLLGQADSAYKYIYKAYKLHQQLNSRSGEAGALIALAKAMFQKGDIKNAELMAVRSLTLSQEIKFTAQLPDVTQFLKKVYLQQKNYEKALWAYEEYVSIRDSMANEKTRKMAMQKEFDYNFEKKEHENKLLAQKNQIQLLEINKSRSLVLGLILLVLIMIVISYLFLKQSRIKAEQQNLQMEQKLLRAQMNPHFIFNSLNSIQQFIISRQNDKAESYLSKFARLIRDLLESNSKDSISIREEVDILRGYIEMESLRFRHSFSFLLQVDERLDQEHILIPHMMIQPFIENAIWHGLLPKEGDRALQVRFEARNESTVCCVVDDNGIGRAESKKKESTFKKKSLALSFINQRIRLMSKTLKVDCSVNIKDKMGSDGKSAGTTVVIVLPILKK